MPWREALVFVKEILKHFRRPKLESEIAQPKKKAFARGGEELLRMMAYKSLVRLREKVL